MVKRILTDAGFTENVDFRETRFLKPPRITYAVYMDSYERRGADGLNLITDHDYTIELYAYQPDANAEKRIENALDAAGIEYEKQDRYWLNDEGLYQTIYTFNHVEK